jgi:hypothetical protein
MDKSHPFDRASTTSRAICIPSRSRAILLFHSIFYKYNSYLQLSHIAIILQGAAQTSMATAIQYQIIEACGRTEKCTEMEADPFCMSGSQGQPVPLNGWDRLPLTSAHTKRIGFHFSTFFRSSINVLIVQLSTTAGAGRCQSSSPCLHIIGVFS